MIADYQIRQWLARYLHKEVSLDQFEDWIVQQSWNMHLDSELSAQNLASAIELRLAEYSSGHLDENQLRSELLPFITSYNAVVYVGQNQQVPPSSDSQNRTLTHQSVVWEGEGLFQALVDTQRVAVSV